jgi:hypothetical protein
MACETLAPSLSFKPCPQKIVISCFDKSTNMVKPWADAGYLCYCVDIQHPPGEAREGNIIKVGADMRDWLPPRGPIAFAAFFPPCTDVAVSGARWFKDKGIGSLINALSLFDVSIKLAEWSEAPYMIENPVSTVSTYWRKPDHTFDPCEYGGYLETSGDAYTKKTCLWTGGGFVMPEKKPIEPTEGSKMHLLPPSPDRADKRSETPRGFAKAVFIANHSEGTPKYVHPLVK